MTKDALNLIKGTILHLTDCDTLEEAIDNFEKVRHKRYLPKSKELFDEIGASQLGILFKLLIDLGEVELEDNVIKSRDAKVEQPAPKEEN